MFYFKQFKRRTLNIRHLPVFDFLILILILMKRLLDLFRNKYFIAIAAFSVWMMFFDKNDIIAQYEYSAQVKKLQQEKDFYEKETASVKKDLKELDSNMISAEKFAREKYFMKKENEDVFVVIKETPED
jgi:cell division protein FtsB